MTQHIASKVEETFSASAVGTNAGVTTTKDAPSDANDRYVVYGIQCSGDAAAVVTVESPASTILYRKRFAAAFNMSETFTAGLFGAAGEAVLVKVSASTANSEANIQGVRI